MITAIFFSISYFITNEFFPFVKCADGHFITLNLIHLKTQGWHVSTRPKGEVRELYLTLTILGDSFVMKL